MSKNLKIDKEKCIHCGKCINDCITQCLEFNDENIPVFTSTGESQCIKCQHCFAICPTGALSICDKNPEVSESVRSAVNSDDLLHLIKSRRSFRKYKQENISVEDMNKLKSMLKYVPTGVNNHRLHFSFIDDIEVMNDFRKNINEKLINLLKKTPINTIIRKFSRYTDAILSGTDVIFRNAPHMLVVASPSDAPCKDVDPIIALSYFELYAQSMGIATLWCGLAEACIMLFPEVCEQLEIPENYKASYVMLFGYSDINYSRTIQPDDCQITSVKSAKAVNVSAIRKIKRFFWNLI